MRVAVTGANGNLGRRLLVQLLGAGHEAIAIVRSSPAAEQVQAAAPSADLHVVSYGDSSGLAQALAGATACVHLVGIIRETPNASFEDTHIAATEALLAAADAAGVQHIVYYSLLGADPESANRCLATRGFAEKLFIDSDIETTVLRVGMVLGEGDYAAAALSSRAGRAFNVAWRASSLEQPIYAGDLADATVHRLAVPAPGIHDIAGPESMPRAELIQRAAHVRGRRTRVVSLPIGLALALADVLEKVLTVPPVSRAMLEVLDHDDDVDPVRSEAALGVPLTSVSALLERVIAPSR